ncbi:hypothetical protein FZ934_20170 (plasmid) [Rhizobium grahamii]|uniref:Uncharacterized protein n=1 Tax=Rhizobium grahamii TaxID=1120045 RepID=A0A5Q0C9R3_9HYPH|nr:MULTISPECIES: hypothetical protein [Rhizobium]QFY62698.1 hypothetical protein FZ934_20170 [Rhizobium grahamii]QRM52558.1 hypothetical protein F3Y33_25490 [Rhizobium sp. BG6]
MTNILAVHTLELQLDDREARRRIGREPKEIRVPLRDGKPDPTDIRAALIAKAADFYFSSLRPLRCVALAGLTANIEDVNAELSCAMYAPGPAAFQDILTQDPRMRDYHPPMKVDPARERLRLERNEFLNEVCRLFLEARETGQLIAGEVPRLSDRSLRIVLPVLCHAAGMERKGLGVPPHQRFVRRFKAFRHEWDPKWVATPDDSVMSATAHDSQKF